jgi:hypothetical protein
MLPIYKATSNYKYRITTKLFASVEMGIKLLANVLIGSFLMTPQRPVDQLLRWHFQQAVIVNTRGTGELVFEHDFPPGSDMIGSITKGAKAAESMEFELLNRFGTQFGLTTIQYSS